MSLQLDSRPIGNVLIIECKGRIVAGTETFSLHSYIGDALIKHSDIVLQLEQVPFIDSSGLGALVRLISKARAKGGDIKLCGIQQQARTALKMTNLLSLFEIYDSMPEAIMAAYLGSRYSKEQSDCAQFRILCVYDGTDMRTFLLEVLCRAGYNVLPTTNLEDAAMLLKMTKAKLVILGSNMRPVRGKPAREILAEIDPSVSLIVLDEHFSEKDPADAATELLERIRSTRPLPA
jgi:anti-sigma B factor antagonist